MAVGGGQKASLALDIIIIVYLYYVIHVIKSYGIIFRIITFIFHPGSICYILHKSIICKAYTYKIIDCGNYFYGF